MEQDNKKDKKFGMVSIPLHEYEDLRAQGRMTVSYTHLTLPTKRIV